MNNKKAVFSTLFCIFIAALFILGCNNHLLKPQQDEPRLLVKIANSTGARNATTTGEWQISAWIENRDGTKSHQQNVTSASGSEASITFDDLVIGSQIKIHLEVTKIDDTQTKFTGESGWTTIKEGVNVIVIVLREISSTGKDESDSPASGENQAPDPSTPAEPPAIVNAETPVIGEITSTIKTYTSDPESVTATLEADASVADGGTLTYQWYSNTTNSTANGTLIEGATSATYEATVDAGTTKYFYCVVTNTNDNVNGNKTASATSNIATVASIVGQLDSITAQYIGNHELVNSEINYSNIEIVQVYTIPDAEPQEISVVASSVKDQYTIVLQEPTNAIGNVPATVIHTETKKQTTVTIPVKYELKEEYVSATGAQIAQYTGSHSLSASYNDPSVSLKLYQNNTFSELTDYVNYTWNPSTVDNTKTTSYTLTVSSKNEWCILPSEGITKEVTVSVTPWTLEINADSPENLAGGQGYTLTATNTSGTATGITYESDNTSFSISGNTLTTPAATTSPQSATIAAKYNGQTLDTLEVTVPAEAAPSDGISTQEQLVQAIASASPDDTITLSNTITITETLVIDKNIRIEGNGDISLLRANTGTITGPMIEVKMGVTLDLSSITLDGQWNNSFTEGKNNPLIYINSGILMLTSVELKNNYMTTTGANYTDKNNNSVALKSAAAIYALDSQLQIMDCDFTNFYANNTNGGVINIEATIADITSIYISGSTIEACTGTNSNALQMGSTDTVFGYISYDINDIMDGLSRQIKSITPDSP